VRDGSSRSSVSSFDAFKNLASAGDAIVFRSRVDDPRPSFP
jgi:hypothetical protein